ncbi:MAG: hypothetical protein AAFW68_04690 [Pseudomonadota bacterium]
MADVIAPPLYRLTQGLPPYFEQSRRALESHLRSEFQIEDSLPSTRWGVRRVVLRGPDEGRTLQEAMVSEGAVRVFPQSDDHDFIRRLLVLEARARDMRSGLWALPAYRQFDALNAEGAIGAFHLVEGAIVRAERFGARFYLNFDDDFRTDFTATAASTLYRRWRRNDFDLASLNSARVRIRGYVQSINGPSIDLKHPLQIERVG